MSSSSVGRARKSARNQRIWSLATAAAAVAVVLAVGHLASGPVTPAEAGNPRAAAPAVQPAAAPEVIAKSALIEPGQRKNRRSRVAGISIVQGELYLWGWGICGAKGYKTEDWCAGEYVKFRQDNQAPYKVEGLPRGAITEVTAQKYNFNALDTAGYVWGWGSISSVDGTGGSEQERNTTGSNKNQKHGIGYGASYPPKRLRIGAAWDNSCRQVGKSTIITNCNRPYLGEGDPVEILSSTEFSGAAVTKAGLIYSWGGKGWGGVAEGSETVAGHTDGSNRYGAIQVQGLPDPTIEGNRPIQLLGGYQTYWVLLENGDVYYFGGTPPGINLGWDSDWERAEGDQPNQYSGRTGTSYPDGTAQIAVKSRALAPWFRSVNPDEYVVQVHSGSAAGVAMLSTGRLLTWGTESPDDYDGGAIGRQCPSSPAATRNACYHRPAPVDFKAIRPQPSIVRVSAAFTGVTALAEDGTLYGWGGAHTSWEGYPDYWKPKPGVSSEVPEYASSFTGDGGVIVVARNVVDFQDGQGYIMWWERDGSHWARGWNRYGQAGHTAANWGVGGLSARHDETRTRQVWFSKPQYEDCKPEWVTPAWDDLSVQDPLTERLFKIGKDYTTTYNGTEYYCSDLNIKNPDGTWANRYTFEQCLAGMCAAP